MPTYSGLFVSVDGGRTWMMKTTEQGLPEDQVTSVSIQEGNVFVTAPGGIAVQNIDQLR